MIALHHAVGSPHSAAVRMVLAEKGLAYESHVLDLGAFEQHRPPFLALSPDGQVPVLEDEGARIHETFLILQYLDERYPAPALGGEGVRSHYAVQKWGKYVETHIAPSLALVRWRALEGSVPREAGAALEALPTPRRDLWHKAAQGFSDDELNRARATLVKAADRLAADLRESPWLAGGGPTIADYAVYPHVAQFAELGVAVPPEVSAWLERMELIPSVAADSGRRALVATMGPEGGRWG